MSSFYTWSISSVCIDIAEELIPREELTPVRNSFRLSIRWTIDNRNLLADGLVVIQTALGKVVRIVGLIAVENRKQKFWLQLGCHAPSILFYRNRVISEQIITTCITDWVAERIAVKHSQEVLAKAKIMDVDIG